MLEFNKLELISIPLQFLEYLQTKTFFILHRLAALKRWGLLFEPPWMWYECIVTLIGEVEEESCPIDYKMTLWSPAVGLGWWTLPEASKDTHPNPLAGDQKSFSNHRGAWFLKKDINHMHYKYSLWSVPLLTYFIICRKMVDNLLIVLLIYSCKSVNMITSVKEKILKHEEVQRPHSVNGKMQIEL